MSASHPFPEPIYRFLRDFETRRRRVKMMRAMIDAFLLVLIWTLVVAIADRLFHLPGWMRALLMAVVTVIVLVALVRPIRSWLFQPFDWVHTALSIESTQKRFAQRLVTVASQLLNPASTRGSEQILGVLLGNVTGVIETAPRPSVGWRLLIRPGAALLLVSMLGLLLTFLPWLDLPTLLRRQWAPLSGIPAVTTTRIDVAPGSVDVPEREPVTVFATIKHLAGAAPRIHFTSNNRDWDDAPMAPQSEDLFTFTFTQPDRDIQYYITAGDGQTPHYTLCVLRRPAIADFRIRYIYPGYTGRSPLSTHNSDGLIEAPQGSEAVLAIVCTEPLHSAFIVTSGIRREMTATSEPNVHQTQLSINKDQTYELELISVRGVAAKGPQNLHIRAVPDRPPLVRLLQPSGDLRLNSREIIPLAYQALDDYGVASLGAHLQINARDQTDFALRMRGADRRRLEGTFDLDLAQFDLKVGDVVSIEIEASDKAAQKSRSEIRHILISPRSVDVATHQRIAELANAAEYAMTCADQLARAQKFLEEARKGSEVEQSASLVRVGRQLAAANESALLLRQTLLRAMMYCASPRMGDLVAQWVDSVTVALDYADRIDQALAASHKFDETAAARLSRLVSSSRELATQVRQLSEGEQAAVIQADRANLKMSAPLPSTHPADRAAVDRRRITLERVRQETAASLTAIGINPKDPAVDTLVQQRIDVTTRLLSTARPVDLLGGAQRWSSAMRGAEKLPPQFDQRLIAAAQAEAVRPDADLVAARDLQLVARVVQSLAQPVELSQDSAGKQRLKEVLDQFPPALSSLRAEHDMNRKLLRVSTPREARDIQSAAWPVCKAASAARAKMIEWSSARGISADELAARIREAEDLAMAANAYTFAREFDKASEADRKLAARLGKPELASVSDLPRAIDRLAQAQEQISDQQLSAAADVSAQKSLAEEIGAARSTSIAGNDAGDSRQKTTMAIGLAQQRLATMPSQLTAVHEFALALAEVSERLVAARSGAGNTADIQPQTAQRLVSMIQSEEVDARKAYSAALRGISGSVLDEMIEALRPYVPDTSTAISAIDDQLRTALADYGRDVAEAMRGQEPGLAEQSAQAARHAIQQAQEALREAQLRVMERDPLVSARWFAQAAATAMAEDDPDRKQAALHQQNTLEALTRAGVDAVRRSKNARLSQLPSFAPFYLPPLTPWSEGEKRNAGDRLYQALPGLREWGRLRERLGESISAPVRESDPPGYTDSLRIYFEVLSREDSVKPQEPRK